MGNLPNDMSSGGTRVISVVIGALSAEVRVAAGFALDDVREYWERFFGDASFGMETTAPALQLLLGSADNLPGIAALELSGAIPVYTAGPEGFALDILTVDGQATAVLRAQDSFGYQYALYAFAEHYLGVRFTHPFWDVIPQTPPCPATLSLSETPDRPLRLFFEASHTHYGLRGTLKRESHFSDVGAWRWEDTAGNAERMRRLMAWAIKLRANTILFDGADPGKGELPSAALWEYMDARGLQILLNIHPNNAPRPYVHPGACEEDFCLGTSELAQIFSRQLCVEKPGFWTVLADKLAQAQRHQHHLAGLFCMWDEGPNAIGVVEATEELAYCECPQCGTVPNTRLWTRVLDHLNSAEVAALNLPPIGHGHMGWKNATPDDALLAAEVAPHLAPGSLSMIYYYTNDKSAETMEGWLRAVDEANARDGGARRIFALRELQFACHADMPMVHPWSLLRVDEDFPVFLKYDSFATYACGVYVMHSMGWLLARYILHKQWDARGTWQQWLADSFAGILGTDGAQALVTALDTLQDVQLYHRRHAQKFLTNYDNWGLDPYLATPDSLPIPPDTPILWDYRPDIFAITDQATRFIRLVKAGMTDAHGTFTRENLQPALEVTAKLRAQLIEIEDTLQTVRHAVLQTPDVDFWVEHLLQPMRWTLAYLRSRTDLFLSYGCYLRAQQAYRQQQDPTLPLAEGARRCRSVLDHLNIYVRFKPGFANDYPREIRLETTRLLLEDWQRFAQHPELLQQWDLCAWLDQAEKRAELLDACPACAGVP